MNARSYLAVFALIGLLLTWNMRVAYGISDPCDGGGCTPTANAGTNQVVDSGALVTLSGSGSASIGTVTSYQWSQLDTGGPSVTLSDPTASSVSFTAPTPVVTTTLTFQLTVSTDRGWGSAPATVYVTVRGTAAAVFVLQDHPLVAIGPETGHASSGNTFTSHGMTVTNLSATALDPAYFVIPFVWVDVSGSGSYQSLSWNNDRNGWHADDFDGTSLTVRLSSPGSGTVTMAEIADLSGVQQLPLTEPCSNSSSCVSNLAPAETVAATDRVPVIALGAFAANETKSLDLSLTYEFADQRVQAFTTLVLGHSLQLLPNSSANVAPTAQVVTEQTGDRLKPVALYGSGSDPDGLVLGYQWTQTGTGGLPAVTLSGADSANPRFTAPDVVADTQLSFQLVVTDDRGASSPPATVNVLVKYVDYNGKPVALTGNDQVVREGATVVLEGSGIDGDGTIASYQWTQAGVGDLAPVTLIGADTATPHFTAPKVTQDSIFTFQLVVTDNSGAQSSPATVNVTVQPVAFVPVLTNTAAKILKVVDPGFGLYLSDRLGYVLAATGLTAPAVIHEATPLRTFAGKRWKPKSKIRGGVYDKNLKHYSVLETSGKGSSRTVKEWVFDLVTGNATQAKPKLLTMKEVLQRESALAADVTGDGIVSARYLLVFAPASWERASKLASRLGGHLATFEQVGESAAFWQRLQNSGVVGKLSGHRAKDGGGAAFVWLGGSDAVAEGDWRWFDQTPIQNAVWGSGALGQEPDNFPVKKLRQNYLAMGLENWPAGSAAGQGMGDAGQWNDLIGTDKLPFVVEFE